MTEIPKRHTNFQDGFITRNKIKPTRYYTDNEFLDMGYGAFLRGKASVYYCLLKYANSETQTCYPNYKTIMKCTGIKSKNRITGILNMLEYLKMIVVKSPPHRKSNTYYILAHTQWRELIGTHIDTASAVFKMTRKEYLKCRETGIYMSTQSQRTKSINEIKNINNDKNDVDGFSHISNGVKKYGRKI